MQLRRWRREHSCETRGARDERRYEAEEARAERRRKARRAHVRLSKENGKSKKEKRNQKNDRTTIRIYLSNMLRPTELQCTDHCFACGRCDQISPKKRKKIKISQICEADPWQAVPTVALKEHV